MEKTYSKPPDANEGVHSKVDMISEYKIEETRHKRKNPAIKGPLKEKGICKIEIEEF